jgi:hypothetical protein
VKRAATLTRTWRRSWVSRASRSPSRCRWLRMPDEVRNMCRLADISSKSTLLQIVGQGDPKKMLALVEKVAQRWWHDPEGPAGRDRQRQAGTDGRRPSCSRFKAADEGAQGPAEPSASIPPTAPGTMSAGRQSRQLEVVPSSLLLVFARSNRSKRARALDRGRGGEGSAGKPEAEARGLHSEGVQLSWLT